MGAFYLIVADRFSRLKLGFTKASHKLKARYHTSFGPDMYIYVWDYYYDDRINGMGRHVIENEIFCMVGDTRIYTDAEIFKRYENDSDSTSKDLVDETRRKITQWFHSTPAIKEVYFNAIRIRWSRAPGIYMSQSTLKISK